MDKAAEIFDLYKRLGDKEYIGEPVSQLEHAEQAAHLASLETDDPYIILAAFLHDIGHICEPANLENSMNGFGMISHEKVGADFLRKMEIPERIAYLVEQHVQAKRYLTYSQPEYFNQLSTASKMTLEFQGGIMTPLEALSFEENDDFLVILRLRQWDEAAKEIGQNLNFIDHYENMLRSILVR
ncbi:MAG: HD domain-containing protein [Saprospiraceae bacterium]